MIQIVFDKQNAGLLHGRVLFFGRGMKPQREGASFARRGSDGDASAVRVHDVLAVDYRPRPKFSPDDLVVKDGSKMRFLLFRRHTRTVIGHGEIDRLARGFCMGIGKRSFRPNRAWLRKRC